MRIVYFIKKSLSFFNLESELESQDVVNEEVRKGIVFKGTNLWILIFAIVIASVGLNMNSTAVIIGAMLISPLMGPINGMGYSLAIYDFVLFRRAVRNFTFAIIASLLASTLYFTITPVSSAASELLARTSPTIYDVIIALFGGLAGIVAIATKQKGNVLPGVAIATALMPPLCTAGYGLATGQLYFFFGAFYLFTINTIFIAIASVWISQLLKFPIKSIIDLRSKKRIKRIINAILLVVFLPSIYFGYKLVQQESFSRRANQYISNISSFEGNYLLKHEIDAKNHSILLVYGGTSLSDTQKSNIIKLAADFELRDATIVVNQGLSLGNLDEKNLELYKLRDQIVNLNNLLAQKNVSLDSIHNQQHVGATLLSELKVFYPQIITCSYSETVIYHAVDSASVATSIVVLSLNRSLASDDETKIENWIKERLGKQKVKVFYE